MSAFLFCDMPIKDQAHQKNKTLDSPPRLINATNVIEPMISIENLVFEKSIFHILLIIEVFLAYF